jgi:hypothetical protein
MAILIGALLASLVGLLGTTAKFDRDRAFYPTVMIVVASYYALFAVMGANTGAIVFESLVGAVFAIFAVSAFRGSLWIVAAALAAHGLFDLVHGRLIDNAGVPSWWPEFCLSFDVAAAAYLAWLLMSGRTKSLRYNAE